MRTNFRVLKSSVSREFLEDVWHYYRHSKRDLENAVARLAGEKTKLVVNGVSEFDDFDLRITGCGDVYLKRLRLMKWNETNAPCILKGNGNYINHDVKCS